MSSVNAFDRFENRSSNLVEREFSTIDRLRPDAWASHGNRVLTRSTRTTIRQYGLEPTPHAYVEHLREVFGELRRVPADEGTVWLNLGDCYSASPPGRSDNALLRNSSLHGRDAAAKCRDLVWFWCAGG